MKKYIIDKISNNIPRYLVLLIDLLIVTINFILTYFILENFSREIDYIKLLIQLPYTVVIALVSFLIVGSYKGVIRYTGLRDTISLYISITLMSILFVFINYASETLNISSLYRLPFSYIIVLFLLNVMLLVTSRFLFKFVYKTLIKNPLNTINVMIFGAGELGTIVYSTLEKENVQRNKVRCFIDDDPRKKGKRIDRINIYGLEKIDEYFVNSRGIEEVIIATDKISQKRLLEVSDKFLTLGVKVKIVPPVVNWVEGDLSVNQIKEINIEDLLNRTPINIKNTLIETEVSQKVILITGAAGSIGAGIVEQLANYNCEKMILIDQAESSLYDLQQKLKRNKKGNIVCYVADVRDVNMMEMIFQRHKPNLIFHAAAYKHVPLMEENPYEAVKVNVVGTKIIADLSCKFNIDKFVMISSDKAVNPTSVMGATKRVAELYVGTKNKRTKGTKFITTRFGNVLGSNGSVIPLFKKQIAEGGPITLTHPEITRYFMTIPEACQLVIEAGAMGVGGEIFIFDMGKSVKIIDLAKRMIKLSGLHYPNDIDIKITGLRPGEKLYEELLNDGENALPTHHQKIMINKSEVFNVQEKVNLIKQLIQINHPENNIQIVEKMKEIVPEFISNNSIFENLDK
ncbi:polysaccharide biosynthesis protein [Wenyingzhuangia marina]|uniref:NDP-sugar epimerase, includes UDP-GlcNAc-inverting 4,6-dehydratase FlaA1 and capsular polysaccharide biosynthesis protein EpsC n=1 Tax=Wenyingzhuangia marina TaxID=1195760 RepID=A0A1M5WDF9_9FLAO|nr:nucleoside-diphosphate sugar epimerase/dehydratase [Wenyingzhuangia marina]GGF81734.1 capsular polysaccharide biosynthesis protein [Wenyingzhuangia marina]SHH85457.1 NDP-sugar epimerase, includes UDP-GlcNAc-inverting 4,6-dehydratase FlaA1 and capsular polysaccharide biosynthesis protein EpsC [Wenyingzhuangia marina]